MGIEGEYQHPPQGEVDIEPAVLEDLIGPNPPTPTGNHPPFEETDMPALVDDVDDPDDPFVRFELPPTPEPQPCAPAAGADDNMDISHDRMMNGESPFDLDMQDEDDAMVSTLILAGANMNQAKTYAAAVRGKTDAPTFMELYGVARS